MKNDKKGRPDMRPFETRCEAKTSLSRVRIALLTMLFAVGGCASTIKNRDPLDRVFPTVTGKTLTEADVTLPETWAGEPVLLLVGYLQDSQFDLDRWTLGLLQAKMPCKIVEVPTIAGLIPSMISQTIDDGMRSGIPKEDWASVITLYGESAKPVVEMTGNENGRNGRIILLDSTGRIVWFWDQGFSAKRLLELKAKVVKLTSMKKR
tara:strand:- start:4014 stop:4634 length:621 start_codon:yes stop_codon:yes gene_type:complete